MNLASLTDATWKRVVMAALTSAAIIFSLQTFASSSYIQTEKIRQETARGQHCLKWQVHEVNDQQIVECLRWETK